MGHLMGYVYIYSDEEECSDLKVHGGVTYYYKKIGFDCAHWGDGVPNWADGVLKEQNSTLAPYRNIAYVQEECRKLSQQLYERVNGVLTLSFPDTTPKDYRPPHSNLELELENEIQELTKLSKLLLGEK